MESGRALYFRCGRWSDRPTTFASTQSAASERLECETLETVPRLETVTLGTSTLEAAASRLSGVRCLRALRRAPSE